MSRVTICADCGASMVNSSDRYCPGCLDIRLAPTEADAVKRIVAWLRAERDAWSTSTEGREICASLAWAADAIERGDWRSGGDNRG